MRSIVIESITIAIILAIYLFAVMFYFIYLFTNFNEANQSKDVSTLIIKLFVTLKP